MLGTGVAGEFWPIIFISVFLTSVYGAVTEVLLLIGFAVLVGCAAAVARRARPPRLLRIVRDTLHTTGQVGVRASVFFLALLVFLAADAGFEFVLGAFTAGVLVGLVLDSPDGQIVRVRLEGIGFGFLVPVYFVVTGMNFDLDSLLSAEGLVLAAVFLALLLVSRGASALLWLRELGGRRTASLALFGATGLPLIVAIVGIGQEKRRHLRRRGGVAHRRGDDLGARVPVRRDPARGNPLAPVEREAGESTRVVGWASRRPIPPSGSSPSSQGGRTSRCSGRRPARRASRWSTGEEHAGGSSRSSEAM